MKFNLQLKMALFIMGAMFSETPLWAAYHPIIFLHGHETRAKPSGESGGWRSWGRENSAMRRILDESHRGYRNGVPLNCDKDSVPISTGGDVKKIYNFSYYNPDGSRGAIGSNGNLCPDPPDQEYNNNVNHAQWAKHLADFIAKVLNACYGSNWQSNPNAEVDIVAHSMGGLVSRSLAQYSTHNDKMRKISLVGALNADSKDNEEEKKNNAKAIALELLAGTSCGVATAYFLTPRPTGELTDIIAAPFMVLSLYGVTPLAASLGTTYAGKELGQNGSFWSAWIGSFLTSGIGWLLISTQVWDIESFTLGVIGWGISAGVGATVGYNIK